MKNRILHAFLMALIGLTVISQPASKIAAGENTVAPVRARWVASADGVRIAYDVRGEGDVALVFVHCWACNRFFWRDQVDEFSSRYRMVTVDLAGHGQSGTNREHWTVQSLAQDVVAVAKDLKLKKMILIGHSLGGRVCLEAAPLMKGRVLGVVLVDIMNDVSQRVTPAEAEADAAKLRQDFKGYFRDLSPLFSVHADPAVRHWVEEQAIAADPVPMIALKLDIPNVVSAELFVHAGIPIRAINAMPPLSDRTTIEENKKYADYNAILIPDAGHFLQLERPKEFNRALDRWLHELTLTPQ